MHGYVIRAREALEFSRLVRRVHPDTLSQIEVVNAARRPLLPYAALVLEHIVRKAEPRDVVFSALGVREGLLYSLLDAEERRKDALLAAAQELNRLRSRSPQHGEELIGWTDAFMATSGIDENSEEKRLRHAACLVADIGWRAHPDYRGEQSLSIIAHAAFVGIDHPVAPISRSRSSSATSVCCTTRNCRRASVNWPRPARSIVPGCSVRRSGWPTWCPPRSRACCRARRSRSSGIVWCCASRGDGGACRRARLVAPEAARASRRPRAGGADIMADEKTQIIGVWKLVSVMYEDQETKAMTPIMGIIRAVIRSPPPTADGWRWRRRRAARRRRPTRSGRRRSAP